MAQGAEILKEEGAGLGAAQRSPGLPPPPPTAAFFQGLGSRRTASLGGGPLAFTHPNEQLREINASNCQTIKSYIRGRIPPPPA